MEKVVTQQAVDEAASQIVNAGGKPTFRAIQQRVGGSFTTIRPMLRDWEARQGRPDPVAPPVPSALLDRGAELVRSIYADAHQQAQTAVEELRAETGAQLLGVQAELAEATEEISRLETEVAECDRRVAALSTANREQELAMSRLEERVRRLDDVERSLGDTRSALARAEQRAADLQANLDAAPGLAQQLDALRQQLGALSDGTKKR